MKKLLFTPLLFASAYLLLAQQAYQSNEYIVEVRPQGQRQTILITGYRGTSVNLVIPEMINGCPVLAIGDNAFRSRQIQTVIFPRTLTTIGNYAFFDNRLTTISIPPTVTTIGIGAFDNNYITVTPAAPPAGGATYVRTFTIEPVHGGSVYAERPQPVDITVHQGYNPIKGTPGASNVMPQQGGAAGGVSTYVYTQPAQSYITQQYPDRYSTGGGGVTRTNTQNTAPSHSTYYPQYDKGVYQRDSNQPVNNGKNQQVFRIISEDSIDLGTNATTLYPGPPVQNFTVEKNYWGPIGARAVPR
jgi:hypothetical protein